MIPKVIGGPGASLEYRCFLGSLAGIMAGILIGQRSLLLVGVLCFFAFAVMPYYARFCAWATKDILD